MNAKSLLRALSEIDPQYLEAALKAGEQQNQPESAQTALSQTAEEISAEPVQIRRSGIGRKLRIAGWSAAAACLLLVGGAMLHLRQSAKENVFVPPASQNEEILEVTGTASVTQHSGQNTAALTTATRRIMTSAVTLPVQTGDVTQNQQQSGESEPQQPAVTRDAPASTARTQPTEGGQHTQSSVTTASSIAPTDTGTPGPGAVSDTPVLEATADQQGTLPDGKMRFILVNDPAEIARYLSGETTEVTLGEGQKPSDVTDRILNNPQMIRVQWQTQDNRWEVYGIQSAGIDANGVLHLEIGMYTSGLRNDGVPWVYETALLYADGSLPQITDVQVHWQYFEEQGGISQWLAFQASLAEDVSITIR